MKFTNELPTKEGTQFVAVWSYDGELWSEVYMVDDEETYLVYHSDTDQFIPDNFSPIWEVEDIANIQYVIEE